MNLWFGKITFILGFFAVGYFRDPFIKKNKTVKIAENHKSKFDIGLILLAALGGTVAPVIWMIFHVFSFADYPLYPGMYVIGLVILIAGLWLLKRSHEDLDTNWSVSLELKENHKLVENGVYKKIRHPMYSAFLLYYGAQVFLIPNWIIGPLGLLSFIILFVCRVGFEESMMSKRFGDKYENYKIRTKRLIPGVW